MSVNMAEFHARYPGARLPHWFDGVELLGRPSEWSSPVTRVWVTAILWAMGDRTVGLPVYDRMRAHRIMRGFGEPAGSTGG